MAFLAVLFLLLLLPQRVFAAVVDAAENVNTVQASTLQANVKGAESISMGYLGQLVIGLLLVLVCIVALAWFAKRFNRLQSTSNGNLQVIGGLSMGARERIVLVQVGSEQLLLGVAPGRVNTLHVLQQSITPQQGNERGNSVGGGFADKLASALVGKKT